MRSTADEDRASSWMETRRSIASSSYVDDESSRPENDRRIRGIIIDDRGPLGRDEDECRDRPDRRHVVQAGGGDDVATGEGNENARSGIQELVAVRIRQRDGERW